MQRPPVSLSSIQNESMQPSYFCWHSSLTTIFFVAVATLVPVPITFCVVDARADTTGVFVAARPRFATRFVDGADDVGAVREVRAARAVDVPTVDDAVSDVASARVFRPVGRVADMPSQIKPAINSDTIAIFFIKIPSLIFFILSYLGF